MTSPIARNILWVVWGVLLAAFAVFIALAFGVPRGARAYVRDATRALEANVFVPEGDVELCTPACQRRGAGETVRAEEGAEIQPLGAGASKAMVRFFDGSQVTLEGHGRLRLDTMRRPRFPIGESPNVVTLVLERDERTPADALAVLRVGTRYDDGSQGPREFWIETADARILVAPDTHARLEMADGELRVYHEAGAGTLTVRGNGIMLGSEDGRDGRFIVLGVGERTVIGRDGIPAPAQADPEGLIAAAGFQEEAGRRGWEHIPAPVAFQSPPESAWVYGEDGAALLSLRREDSRKSPADLVLRHDLGNVSLADATYLALTATLRVNAQSLPGGGDRAEEYPLLLTLVAVDDDGDEFAWRMGFYTLAPDPEAEEFSGARVDPVRSRYVETGVWTEFDSGNLLEGSNALAFAHLPTPRRAVALKRVEIKASGHDFHSEIAAIQVWWK